MPQSLSQVYLHSVWSTKNRIPFIRPQIEDELYTYIGGTIKNLGGRPIQINGMPDHIHVLSTLPRTISIADFLEEIKRSSSKWLKTKGWEYREFSWQRGYGAFSVGRSELSIIQQYIVNQKTHHTAKDFKVELIEWLKEYEVDYNEEYLWD